MKHDFTIDDVIVILGDVGINYFGGVEDQNFKRLLSRLEVILLCIHGNHEMRPESLKTYEEADRFGGVIYHEPEFPYLLFAKDGEVYELDGKRCIAIGGAYSVDKDVRIANDWGWWPDEQPSDEIKERVEARLDTEKWNIDIVFSHTCPYKYIPHEKHIPGIDPRTVDNRTEKWLDTIEDKLTYSRWYCGHFHTEKVVEKMRFMYKDVIELEC